MSIGYLSTTLTTPCDGNLICTIILLQNLGLLPETINSSEDDKSLLFWQKNKSLQNEEDFTVEFTLCEKRTGAFS